jgi:D-alanyl-D-alanine carboxypeptidase/D-alanyl-D-alanine-endopeptidase (penicillin-binding protein 4)
VRSALPLILLILSGLVLLPAPSPAIEDETLAKRLDTIIDGPDYKHASWAILVVDAKTGETIYARHPNAMLAPASVTKLFSGAAAIIALGPDCKFETNVYQRGTVQAGTLRGDLVLLASGDLTLGGRTDKNGKIVFKDKDHTYANSGLADAELTDTDPLAGLNDLAKQVKDSGITQIDGDVLIDDRFFARTRGSGSGPDAVSPIMVNDNVIDILVEPGDKEGDAAKVTMRPETAFFQADSLVTTAPEGDKSDVQVLPVGLQQFAVRGHIAKGAKPIVRIYPIEEPALFARTLFIEALRRNGVRANASVLRPSGVALPEKTGYGKLIRVASFSSPPFKEALAVTLKVSHNLYASTLPCLVASTKGLMTAEQGLRAERKIFKDLGVDLNSISFGGGAGGAPADHVSARAVVQLLQGMSKRDEWEAYKAGLPILGVDGTLAEVVGSDSPARGKVFAKTGTLVWVDSVNDRLLLKSKAVGGTMTTKAGTSLFFAIMVNNVPLPKGVTTAREGKVLGKLCEIIYEKGP